MKPSLKNIAAIVVLLALPICTVSGQNRYNFNFDKDFEWVDILMDPQADYQAVKEGVKFLREELSIEEGRILLRELSKLDSLNALNSLSEVIDRDLSVNREYFKSVFKENFPKAQYIDNFVGLINAAVSVIKLRDKFNEEKKPFENKEYFVKETELVEPDITLEFEYSGAEKVLDLLEHIKPGDNPRKIVESYQFSDDIKDFFKGCIDEEDIFGSFGSVTTRDPLTRIYMIANPLSFLSLGGVSIYKEQYANTINVIKNHERDIVSHVTYLLSQFYPENLYVFNKIHVVFGSNTCGTRGKDGSIFFDLSRFGNDYEKMTRFITREIFYDKKKALQLDLCKYFFANEDTLLYELINEVYSNGISNYIAPVLRANRPSILLEKDFLLFKRTQKAIISREPQIIIDSLFRVGINDMYFYSMGAQMAYCIDVYSGRNLLKNSLLFGPLYFFKTYVETYKLDDSKIRKVFRLPAEFENKLYSMNYEISYDMLNDVMKIKLQYNDSSDVNREISSLFRKYKNRRDLWFLHLISGKLLLDKNLYVNSLDHFMLCMQGIPRKDKFVSDIGDIFFNLGAFEQSLVMFEKYITYSAGSADSYLKRGMAYFELGEKEKANEDFKMTLSLDPENVKAKEYLDK